ncbi:MAG: hypothetical protein VX738_15290 [Planctomycetota bacterium]|nr:hypothetical protein [Planctomycetota bacterium]
MKRLLLSCMLLLLLPGVSQGQRFEKGNQANTAMAKLLHAAFSKADVETVCDQFVNPKSLVKAAEVAFADDPDAELSKQVRNYIQAVLKVKDSKETVQRLIAGGQSGVNWNRVYLKRVFQLPLIDQTGLKIYRMIVQFNEGARTIWLESLFVELDGKTHNLNLSQWKTKDDGVENIPVPETYTDVVAMARLRDSLEIEGDRSRYPAVISKRDLSRVQVEVAQFQQANTAKELGAFVFNLCVTGDFELAGKAVLPASLNQKMENLNQAQMKVLAALETEKLFADSMMYWRFHWKDSVLKSVTPRENLIRVVFDTVLQKEGGKRQAVELMFDIIRPHQVEGSWFFSSLPEYPTGITPVSMGGVLIDTSSLVPVSGIVTLDGKPVSNAAVTMIPSGASPKRSRAERGLNSRIPSGRTDAKGRFVMNIVYGTYDRRPAAFKKIPPNKYVVGVVSAIPRDDDESNTPNGLPEVEPKKTDRDSSGESKIPLVFANPLGLKSDTKFLNVDRPLSQVRIKLTSDGTIEVVADPK